MPGIGSGDPAQSLGLGFDYACVLLESGTSQCWGSSTWGTLGSTGSTTSTPRNVTVIPLGRSVLDLSVARTHVCALLDNASVVCWGDNDEGQLGDGTLTDRTTAVYPDLQQRRVLSLDAVSYTHLTLPTKA